MLITHFFPLPPFTFNLIPKKWGGRMIAPADAGEESPNTTGHGGS